MQINRTNIEEHLFEYFEGLMNPQQADALMAFIHQHPEYETELAQWHKTYHHKNHVLEDYGIAKDLKKPLPKAFVFRPLYFIGFWTLGILGGWFLNHYDKGSSTTEIMVQQRSIDATEPTQSLENKSIAPYRKQITRIQTPIVQSPAEEVKEGTLAPIPMAAPTPTLEEEKPDSVVIVVPTEQKTVKVDTTVAPQRTAPSVPSPKAKKKWGRRGVFGTTDKILPPNNNF